MLVLGLLLTATAADAPEPIWTLREGATQWVDPTAPEWPTDDEGVPVEPAEATERCELLLSVGAATGEVTRVQVQDCAPPFAEGARAAASSWQARVRPGERGSRGVRAGVTWVADPAVPAPVGRTPVEVRVLREAPTTCVASVELSRAGHARITEATHPACLELPAGNKWATRLPRTGRCTVVVDTPPVIASCEPPALAGADALVSVLDGRLASSSAWGERRVEVRFEQPVRSTTAQVPLVPTARAATAWDPEWLDDPPASRADCTVEGIVGPDGQPTELRVWSCEEPWASRAREAVARWRWEPPVRDGAPARVALSVPIRFALDTALPVALSRARYLELREQTGWLLEHLDAGECRVEVDLDSDGSATGVRASHVPDCLVAPAAVDLRRWTRGASAPQTCTMRVRSDGGEPTVLSVGACPDAVRKVLDKKGLDGWVLEAPADGERLYDLVWTLSP